MASEAILRIKVLADASQAARELDNTGSRTSKFASGVSKASKVAAVGLLAVGAAAIKAGRAAAEDAQSQALLATALKNSTGAGKDQVAGVEDFIGKMALATGVADDQLRPAMATLARATGDVETSQKALGVAMDVSAATGKDVESVSAAIAKAYAGNTTSLGRLVPGIDKAVLASGDMTAIMDELAKKTGGSAAAAADTTAGKMARMQVAMDEATESAGAALLPAMSMLATVLGKAATFAQEHTKAVQLMAVGFTVLAVAIMALNVVLKVTTLITKIMGNEMAKAWLKALGPIGLLILAIGLIVVAIVVLWKRSQTFRTIVLAVWNAIKVAAKASANAIKSAFTAAWSKISAAARAVGNVVRAVFNAVRSAIRAVIGVVSSLIGRIRGIKVPGTIKAAFAAIKSAVGAAITVVGNLIAKIKNLSVPGAVKTALNGIKEAAQSALNVIKNIVEWLGNIPTPHINWPSPPKWLDKVMPGMIAPPGVPVARASTAPGVATRGPGGTALAGGTGMGLTINVYGAIDPESTARAVRRVLDGHDRRMGRRVG